MIKAVVFDMDGVLIDAKEWHYEALNRALAIFGLEISRADHLTTFDGLPTRRKLQLLSTMEAFPVGLHEFVNELKQRYVMELIHTRCKPTFAQEQALATLKAENYRLGVASNSVRRSVEAMMTAANLAPYLDLMISNEDVKTPKPDPEMYLTAMERLGVGPEETLILEDNDHGIRAARASGAHVMVVSGVEEVTLPNIRKRLDELNGGRR